MRHPSVEPLFEKLLQTPEVSSRFRLAELDCLAETLACNRRLSRRQADLMFALNEVLPAHLGSEVWRQMFIEALTSHILEDGASPTCISGEEAHFIVQKVMNNGEITCEELHLLVFFGEGVRNLRADDGVRDAENAGDRTGKGGFLRNG